jgi:hypothetical protein
MENIDVSKAVKSLVEKANEAKDANDALKYSQAACNAANAMACLSSIKPADMLGAIAQLEVSLDTATTNEPIYRFEGNTEQADLCLAHAESYRAAIAVLRKL